jgi:hypothetical protein
MNNLKDCAVGKFLTRMEAGGPTRADMIFRAIRPVNPNRSEDSMNIVRVARIDCADVGQPKPASQAQMGRRSATAEFYARLSLPSSIHRVGVPFSKGNESNLKILYES